ncbi:MAG: transposase, partial [Myxococcales bacterium]|nr:transposase [Myxococcales bacterium]
KFGKKNSHIAIDGKASRRTKDVANGIPALHTVSAKEAARIIRRHWGIENELHWVLDMAFREDEARHPLRHFALNVVKQDKTRKLGVAICRQRAGWDKDYLIQLLTGATG